MAPNAEPTNRKLPQHGINGAYYGGDWVDLEDCANTFFPSSDLPTSDQTYRSKCENCPHQSTCDELAGSQVRSRSRLDASKDGKGQEYDVVIIGAGCIGE